MNRNESPGEGAPVLRRAVWVGVVLLWIAATGASCLFLDQVVGGWLLHHPVGWHHNVWVNGFRQLGKAGTPLWLLLAWSCITDRWYPTFALIVAMILVGVSVCPLKASVRRCRPKMAIATSEVSPPQPQNIPWWEKTSFPSGDTAVTFAAATTLSYSLGRLWVPALFVAAGAIGTLRVTIMAHYPSDVLAGALIGVLCGVVAIQWIACWQELDQFRAGVLRRLGMALVLTAIALFLAPFVGMTSLQTFLRVYAVPLAILVLIYLTSTRGQTAMRGAARFVWEGFASRCVPAEKPAPDVDALSDPPPER